MRRFLALSLASLASVSLLGAAGPSSMPKHMEIQATIKKDPELAKLPSVRIDSISATITLDDRMNADVAFDQPFTTELQKGMRWYLEQRGVRVADDGELRVVGTIDHYEGWKGWGRWGVDLTMQVKVLRGEETVATKTLRSFFKYSDEEEVEDEIKPKYKPLRMSVAFPQILFTRVGVDLSQKLIELLQETASKLPSGESAAPPPTPGTPGR